LRESQAKVFGIGLSKTGTTSLYAALDRLGFRAGTYRDLRALCLDAWFRGDFSEDPIRDYDALTDLPIGAFYRELDRRYPGSKFILTHRDRASWLESCRSYFGARPNRDDPFYRNTQIAAYGVVSFDEERFAAAYDAHLEGVTAYFAERPEDLLTLNLFAGDGWEPLCRFLGRPRPTIPFPRVKPGFDPEPARWSADLPGPFGRLLGWIRS